MSIFGNEAEEQVQEDALIAIIVEEAQDLGLLDESGKEISDEQILTERKRASFSTEIKRVKITKKQKIGRLVQRTAMEMASRNKDANWVQWKKHRAMAENFRKKIETKYRSKATSAAREILSGSEGNKKSSDLPKGAGANKT